MREELDKYNIDVLKNIDKDNVQKIILLLEGYGCDYVDDLLEDYLDLFTFEFNEFKEKLDKLNNKYNNKFLDKASEDMNLLDEFYKES